MLNGGEKEKSTVKINAPEEEVLAWLTRQVITRDNPNMTPVLKAAVEDSYKRLIAPAIEREIRSELTEKAEDGAIHVFGKNLEQLLMQPPIVGKVVTDGTRLSVQDVNWLLWILQERFWTLQLFILQLLPQTRRSAQQRKH